MLRRWKVVGYKNIQYKSKKTGQDISGKELQLASDEATPDLVGLEVKQVYLSSRFAYQPQLNEFINLVYNERGYVEEIFRVDSES